MQRKKDPIFEAYPLSLTIPENDHVILYERDNAIRSNLLLALTNNLGTIDTLARGEHAVALGKSNINNISTQGTLSTIQTSDIILQ